MREQPHQRLPLICFAWKINRLYQVLELQKSQSAKKGSVVTPTVPGTKCSRAEGACSGGFGCFIWGRVVFVFVFLSSTRQIRPSSETPRANQPFPTSSSHPPSASSLRCHLPTLPVADAGGWWGHSGKAWPPNSAASEGTVERQEDVPVEGGPERPAFLLSLLLVCLLSRKGRWDQDLKGESSRVPGGTSLVHTPSGSKMAPEGGYL